MQAALQVLVCSLHRDSELQVLDLLLHPITRRLLAFACCVRAASRVIMPDVDEGFCRERSQP